MALDKTLRITLLLVIDSGFAILELATGYAVHSLALVADSFHMFNDVLSLLVALWAVKASKAGSSATYSYGLQRAEVLGALVNAVFLLALCVTIFLEAIQRFIEPQEISNPKLILVIGILGLLSNILGLLLFHEHGHSHGGGGHSHSLDAEQGHAHGHSHEHSHSHRPSERMDFLPESAVAREEQRLLASNATYGSTINGNPIVETDAEHQEHHHTRSKSETTTSKSMNMEGVFLHVMGDALGNIGVIATALFIWKTEYSWRFYFDPVVSLFITAIIFSTAVPLCVRASRVLLQATPPYVNCDQVAEDILSIPGVEEIHDLHIWQLSETHVVATLHITVNSPPSEFSKLSKTVQECFAGYGVPSITIQPEFTETCETPNSGIRQCQSNGNLLSQAQS